MPGETLASTYERVRDLVADDVVSVLPAYGDQLMGDHSWDPVEISDIDSPYFHMLYQYIRAAFPGAQATPILIPELPTRATIAMFASAPSAFHLPRLALKNPTAHMA